MSSHRTVSTGRSLTFISALLLTTALAAPAFAQVEEVVVTAQKRAEDVQSVPIAISAFSQEDLKAHQIDQFKDLQFNAPNTTYSAGNFGGADFQIRGIGITAVGYDSESGVAINQNGSLSLQPADHGRQLLRSVGRRSSRGSTEHIVWPRRDRRRDQRQLRQARISRISATTSSRATRHHYNADDGNGRTSIFRIITDETGHPHRRQTGTSATASSRTSSTTAASKWPRRLFVPRRRCAGSRRTRRRSIFPASSAAKTTITCARTNSFAPAIRRAILGCLPDIRWHTTGERKRDIVCYRVEPAGLGRAALGKRAVLGEEKTWSVQPRSYTNFATRFYRSVGRASDQHGFRIQSIKSQDNFMSGEMGSDDYALAF